MIRLQALIDIGAGSGCKLALVDPDGQTVCRGFLPVKDYGRSGTQFVTRLMGILTRLLDGATLDAVAVAIPGFPTGDMVTGCANLPVLAGYPLARDLRQRLHVPVCLVNDGDAGGLGEWSVRRHELVYWALGGGWGGSWVSPGGQIRHPSTGGGPPLHISAEPGHLARLGRVEVERILEGFGVESHWLPHVPSLPVEHLVSGPGRLRLFAAIADRSSTRDVLANADPGLAVSNRHRQGDPHARQTDAVFGTLLGTAAVAILGTINREAGQATLPVFLGGGVAQAIDLFLPYTRTVLQQVGIRNPLSASQFLTSGGNANLAGAHLFLNSAIEPLSFPTHSVTVHPHAP
jgi:predicted NBD/HSP70 family sugar kinase